MKRKYTRIPFSGVIEFLLEDVSYRAKLKDLSYGGLFVESQVIPPQGKEISLVLFIGESEPQIKIFLKGRVTRVEPGKGFALQYTYIPQESFTHLKNLIYYNFPSPEDAEKELFRFLGEAHPLLKSLQNLNIKIIKDKLIKYIRERAFLYNPENPFILSSGKKSPYYIDCKKITLYSSTFNLIGALFWQRIKYLGVDAVGGMSIGADPLVCAILAKAYEDDVKLEGFLIRKEPKGHGTQSQIEGNVKKGMYVVLVEDVITTGASIIKAAKIAESAGLTVGKILALVDRQEGGRENVEKNGYEFEAFFTLKEIIENKVL